MLIYYRIDITIILSKINWFFPCYKKFLFRWQSLNLFNLKEKWWVISPYILINGIMLLKLNGIYFIITSEDNFI